MKFLAYLIEKKYKDKITMFKACKKDWNNAIEALLHGYDMTEDGKKLYWEWRDNNQMPRYKTIEHWKKARIENMQFCQDEIVSIRNSIMQEWIEYVEKTGDTDSSWNDVLEMFSNEELQDKIKEIEPYIKEPEFELPF